MIYGSTPASRRWIIAIAGFSVVTVEDKFDSNQLVGFNYICMLW